MRKWFNNAQPWKFIFPQFSSNSEWIQISLVEIANFTFAEIPAFRLSEWLPAEIHESSWKHVHNREKLIFEFQKTIKWHWFFTIYFVSFCQFHTSVEGQKFRRYVVSVMVFGFYTVRERLPFPGKKMIIIIRPNSNCISKLRNMRCDIIRLDIGLISPFTLPIKQNFSCNRGKVINWNGFAFDIHVYTFCCFELFCAIAKQLRTPKSEYNFDLFIVVIKLTISFPLDVHSNSSIERAFLVLLEGFIENCCNGCSSWIPETECFNVSMSFLYVCKFSPRRILVRKYSLLLFSRIPPEIHHDFEFPYCDKIRDLS